MASIAVQSGLQLYLRQINESPLLNAQQEKDLARRIINFNDPAAVLNVFDSSSTTPRCLPSL